MREKVPYVGGGGSDDEDNYNVVRPGRRSKLDAATDITVKAIPWIGAASFIYAGLAFLGILPFPSIDFGLIHLVAGMGSLTGLSVFSVVGYVVIKRFKTPDYVHIKLLDTDGEDIDEYSLTPQRFRELEIRGEIMPPVRHTGGGDTVYLCSHRDSDLDAGYIVAASDMEDIPDDDQFIADKQTVRLWRDSILDLAKRGNKMRKTDTVRRERIEAEETVDMARSMEQSSQFGDSVDEILAETIDEYDAIDDDMGDGQEVPDELVDRVLLELQKSDNADVSDLLAGDSND